MKKSLASAVDDFRRAHLQAKLENVVGRLTGRSTELLSYEEVRRSLRARERASEHLADVPLDAIVGSVGRYRDFTRSFLPRRASEKDRWAKVEVAMTGLQGVPPIEVYKIGNAYFVRDGNHRVSVARRMGSDYIQAYVTQVDTRVPLSPSVEPDDLIIKAEQAEFLERTGLDRARPQAALRVTAPGKYRVLLEHIEVHRHFMGINEERHIPYSEAVTHWYDEVYLPVVYLIRERGILRDFPDRTETDLYLWLSQHKVDLESELGWQVRPQMAARDLAMRFSRQPARVAERIGKGILDRITPPELASGPPTGRWREERLAHRPEEQLLADLLVAIRGDERGWIALDQGLTVAEHEGARVRGVHVVPTEAQSEQPEAEAIQAEFHRLCQDAGVEASFAFDVGSVHQRICDRARWADLVVASLDHPPKSRPVSALSSGMAALIRRCPTPILLVPEESSSFQNVMLAFDGTPRAREALFVATYVAGQWAVPLSVLSVLEADQVTSEAIVEARRYLAAHGVEATYEEASRGDHETVADTILRVAADEGCDLLLIGGYGAGPVQEAVLGSTVDQVLRQITLPVLICR